MLVRDLRLEPSPLLAFSCPVCSCLPVKVTSFSRKRESTSHLIKNFMFLALLVCLAVEAGQRPPLPSSGDPKGNTKGDTKKPSSPALQREKEKVLNLGNLIQGRLPENSKDNQSTPSDNVPAVPGVVVQGTLRINVNSFDDFKLCDKNGHCEKICLNDGTGCPRCNATCAELCIRRSTKLCKFRNGKQLASSPMFTSTDSSRFPEFIESMKRICWKPDGTGQSHTSRHRWHYTVSYGGWGSEGGHDHDRPFTGLQDCLNKLMAEGKCRRCQNCKKCISQLKVDSDPDHQRMKDNPF